MGPRVAEHDLVAYLVSCAWNSMHVSFGLENVAEISLRCMRSSSCTANRVTRPRAKCFAKNISLYERCMFDQAARMYATIPERVECERRRSTERKLIDKHVPCLAREA
jgi:hypothetical protein